MVAFVLTTTLLSPQCLSGRLTLPLTLLRQGLFQLPRRHTLFPPSTPNNHDDSNSHATMNFSIGLAAFCSSSTSMNDFTNLAVRSLIHRSDATFIHHSIAPSLHRSITRDRQAKSKLLMVCRPTQWLLHHSPSCYFKCGEASCIWSRII